MFPQIQKIGEKLDSTLESLTKKEYFDAGDLSERFMTDALGKCVFGTEINSLENPESEFRVIGKQVSEFRYLGTPLMFQQK